MRHGHKSHSKGFEGYKASAVVETGHGVILSTEVHAANSPDREGAARQIEDASARAQKPIERVLGDAAYGAVETRRQLVQPGRELVVKTAPASRKKGCFSWEDFQITRHGAKARCPAGKRSIRRERVTIRPSGAKAWRFVFSRRDCTGCPSRSLCTTAKVTARLVTVSDDAWELRRLRKAQRTSGFRRKYRRRVVVERELGHLTARGIRQAKYLGQAKTALQVVLAAAVVNLGKALARLMPSDGPMCALTALLRLLRAIAGLETDRDGSDAGFVAELPIPSAASKVAASRPAF